MGLLGALLLLVDAYVLVIVSRTVGLYLLLAIEASTGILGALYAAHVYRVEMESMRLSVRRGCYPRREFRRMLAVLVAAGCLLVPGFATDALGLLFMIRPFGWPVGVVLERSLRESLEELYEHVRVTW